MLWPKQPSPPVSTIATGQTQSGREEHDHGGWYSRSSCGPISWVRVPAAAVFTLLCNLLLPFLTWVAVLIAAVVVITYYSRRHDVQWRRWLSLNTGPGGWPEVCLLGAVVLAVNVVFIGLVHAVPVLGEFLARFSRDLPGQPVRQLLFVMLLAAPVAEELVFRGLLLGTLRRRGDGKPC